MKNFQNGLLAMLFVTGFLTTGQLLIAAENEEVSSQDWKSELDEINVELDKLTNQRNLYLARATRLQNQGDRLQFENNNLIDARRAWQQAQIHREIATRIQEEIDILEKRKQVILQEHGISSKSSKSGTTNK